MRFTAAAILLLVFSVALAQEPPAPEPEPAWKAAAKTAGLGDSAIVQLESDSLLITNRAYRQIFTPYVEGKLPPFITSDALLNGFHVLFEESVRRLEIAAIQPLRDLLLKLARHLDPARLWFEGDLFRDAAHG